MTNYSIMTQKGINYINNILNSENKILANGWYILVGTGTIETSSDTESLDNPIFGKNSNLIFGEDEYGHYAEIIIPIDLLKQNSISEIGLFNENDLLICFAKTQINLPNDFIGEVRQRIYINAIPAYIQVDYISSDAYLSQLNDKINSACEKVGNMNNLTTIAENLVDAINEIKQIADKKYSIGMIFPAMCSSTYNPEGALPCDGSEYLKTPYMDLWTDFLTGENPKLLTCSYTEYASDIATYGQCARFAVDIENGKFKVPTIKDGAYITQANSDSELGKSYKESLPNIKGQVVTGEQFIGTGGAFYAQESSGTRKQYEEKGTPKTVFFNASHSSSAYQDNAKVQGDNVRLRWFVVVTNSNVSQSAMDWSAWTTSMAQKLNKDHSNDEKPYVTEVSDESLMPSWYRVWSDGWCEQGGRITTTSSGSTYTVSLLKSMLNANYQISLTSTSQSAGIWISDNNQITTNNFKVYVSSNAGGGVHWQVRGYMN